MAKREAQGPLGYPLQVLARSSLWAFRYLADASTLVFTFDHNFFSK
jgi:hypothetical protein